VSRSFAGVEALRDVTLELRQREVVGLIGPNGAGKSTLFGTIAGSMLPFILRRLGLNPASASAPFVATLVDVTGLVIYFTIARFIMLRP